MELKLSAEPVILIVDDQAINITVLTDMLQDLGQVFFATSGKEALAKATELMPDVILLDIEMPGMSGFDVCRQLKDNPHTQAISVIFVTAHAEAEFEFHSLSYGAADFIARPFNRAICRQRVQNHLQLQLQAKALQQSKDALYAESQRLLVTLMSIGDAVIATDTSGLVTFMNPIAEHMTGWREADAIGQPIDEVMCLRDADSKSPSLNPVRIALSERRRVAMALNCELVTRGSGNVVGVEDSASPIFDHADQMVGAIVVFHDVSEARAMALKMTYLANHDQLTGLPNRVLLHDRLARACQIAQTTQNKVGLMLIDIDRFKFVNDSIGHQNGDVLLQKIAKRIGAVLESEHTLARFGGDEFVLIIPEVAHLEQLSNLARQITRMMEKPLQLDGASYSLSLSIGVSVFPDDASSEDELMRNADVALFKAKQEGRNRIHFFSDELGELLQQQHLQEQALRESIKKQRAEVLFQPIVELSTGMVFAAEALVRVRQDDGSLLSPLHFIPLAEETGLIVPLGKQILLKACEQAALWQEQGMKIPVSVNVAAAQFVDPGFINMIEFALLEYGLEPAMLKLEVTETALIRDPNLTSDILRQCQQLGVRIAIDDFGTGYSSLSYLKRFKVDVLKIDMTFVRDMLKDRNDYEIVRVITALGQSMGITLIAEGIETQAHKDSLIALGCQYGQGYLFAKPLSAKDFLHFITSAESVQ